MKKLFSLILILSILSSLSISSFSVSAKSTKKPSAPKITVVKRSNSIAGISWKADSTQYYTIQKRIGSGKFKTIKKYTLGISFFYAEKLKSKVNYTFRVQTYKKVGKKKLYSPWSRAKTIQLSKMKVTYTTSEILTKKFSNSVASIYAYDTWGANTESFAQGYAFPIKVNTNIYFVTTYSMVANSKYVQIKMPNSSNYIRCDNLYAYNKAQNIAIVIPNVPVICDTFELGTTNDIATNDTLYCYSPSKNDWLAYWMDYDNAGIDDDFEAVIVSAQTVTNDTKTTDLISYIGISNGAPILNNKGQVICIGSYDLNSIITNKGYSTGINVEHLSDLLAAPSGAKIESLQKSITFETLPGSKVPVPANSAYTKRDISKGIYYYDTLDIEAYKTQLTNCGFKQMSAIEMSSIQYYTYAYDSYVCCISATTVADKKEITISTTYSSASSSVY